MFRTTYAIYLFFYFSASSSSYFAVSLAIVLRLDWTRCFAFLPDYFAADASIANKCMLKANNAYNDKIKGNICLQMRSLFPYFSMPNEHHCTHMGEM